MLNYSTMLSFLLSATNASAYTNHTLGHAKFTTHVGGGGQGARRIGRERGTRGRKGKDLFLSVIHASEFFQIIVSGRRLCSNYVQIENGKCYFICI